MRPRNPSARPILAELQLGAKRARRAGADDAARAQLAHRPCIRAVWDLVRRQLVHTTMPWEKCDALPGNLADHDRRRRLPVGRLDLDLLRVVEQRVEARPPKTPISASPLIDRVVEIRG